MAKSTSYRRLVLHLDLRITLEAHILNQMNCMPATRRQEWVRRLLVQGFLAECQALPGPPGRTVRRPAPPLTRERVVESKQTIRSPASAVTKQVRSPIDPDAKPFAALGKVIG